MDAHLGIYNKKDRNKCSGLSEPLVGFEPTTPRLQITYNGFQDRRNRPLCHLSKAS